MVTTALWYLTVFALYNKTSHARADSQDQQFGNLAEGENTGSQKQAHLTSEVGWK